MRRSILLPAALVAGALVYFVVPKTHAGTRYLVTGSSTVAPILQAVAEDLAAHDPSLSIEVETGGSGRGIKDAREGLSDLGMSSRELTTDEKVGLTCVPIAHDGIALIVHASNPLEELTKAQVIDVYAGRIHDWSGVGGQPGPIQVVNKAEGRSTLEVFLAHFGLKASEVRADVVIGDNAQGVRLVAGEPGAIGYVSVGEAQRAVASGTPIKLLRYQGVVPSVATIADGTFPIRRTLYLLRKGELDPIAGRIVEYLASDAGRARLEELSFVPIAGEPATLSAEQ